MYKTSTYGPEQGPGCFSGLLRGQAPRRLGAFNISLVSDLPQFIVTPDKR